MSGTILDSPMQTPSKSRRSCQSEYETAGEDDDSDSSLYYSMIDMDQTLENKENSLNISSKLVKRLPKGGSAGTPLLRKTLQKNLVEVQTSMKPRKNANKCVSFDVASNGSQIVHNREQAATTMPPETETNAKNDFENANASGMTDDACDITIVETGAVEAIKPIANKQKSVSFMNTEINVILSDYDEPNKSPILLVQTSSGRKITENKRLSVAVTKKTMKSTNTNASVRNRRQQLAVEAKKAPPKNGRTSIYKRSSMYQPRKSSGRRSIEAMIKAKANKTLLETEVAFADDAPADEANSKVGDSLPTTSTAIEKQSASEQQTNIVSTTSIQNTNSSNKLKEMVQKIPLKELNQPVKTTVSTSITKGKYEI